MVQNTYLALPNHADDLDLISETADFFEDPLELEVSAATVSALLVTIGGLVAALVRMTKNRRAAPGDSLPSGWITERFKKMFSRTEHTQPTRRQAQYHPREGVALLEITEDPPRRIVKSTPSAPRYHGSTSSLVRGPLMR